MKINTAWHDHYRHTLSHTHTHRSIAQCSDPEQIILKRQNKHTDVYSVSSQRVNDDQTSPLIQSTCFWYDPEVLAFWYKQLGAEKTNTIYMQPVITVSSFHHQCEPKRQQEPVKDGSLTVQENDVFTVAVGGVWVYRFSPGHVIYVTF